MNRVGNLAVLDPVAAGATRVVTGHVVHALPHQLGHQQAAPEAAAQAEKFARFRALANAPGDAGRGRELFTAVCLACHQQGGKGGQIAPALDGVAHTGVEALLRNLLTPSAAMESAYQTFRVVTKDGAVTDAFLVEENTEAVVLRREQQLDATGLPLGSSSN